MKIKFIKEYVAVDPATNSGIVHRFGETEEIKDYTAQWLIDNGFAEEVKESGWWKPKKGERYYFIDDSGCIKQDTWQNSFWEVDRYRSGNVFKTEEAVKRYWDFLKAIATVRQDEGVLTPNELQEKERDDKKVVFIGYDSMGHLATNPISLFSYDIVVNAIFFDNEMHAQSSLDNHRKEWETIANYDWSRE